MHPDNDSSAASRKDLLDEAISLRHTLYYGVDPKHPALSDAANRLGGVLARLAAVCVVSVEEVTNLLLTRAAEWRTSWMVDRKVGDAVAQAFEGAAHDLACDCVLTVGDAPASRHLMTGHGGAAS